VRLLFEVQDTGIGIDPAIQARLFQSFQQADNSTTRKYGGTGLGLAISKRLVELMDGEISVASMPGAGSVFRFTVSFVPRTAQPFVPSPSLRGKRVLVIDDNATCRTLLYRWLVGWGLECDLDADLASAQKRLAEHEYAALVIDSGRTPQPVLDAVHLFKRTRTGNPIGLVLLIPFGSQRLANDALGAGFDATVDKPLRQIAVHQALTAALGANDAHLHGQRPAPPRRYFSGRVLVAEDNAVNQRLTAAQLARHGLHADIVGNGREALAAIAQLPYDLVLMDCQMPEMDGYQATREIRARESQSGQRRLPVVAMTANAMAGDRDLCLAAGMDDYLAKPVRMEGLLGVLERFLPEVSAQSATVETPASTTESLIDAKALTRMRDELGDDTTCADMVRLFEQEAPMHLQALLSCGQSLHDADQVRRAAHKLKGSCQIMGAQRLTRACRQIEELVRSGDLAAIPTILNEMPALFDASVVALRKAANELGLG
jgi:CheY-like chemotaxis protein/HPt (histidine-containing phosphotransfer) domain-containing protein